MEIPTDSLRKLPEGAIFSQRDGHLTLDLSMRGDTIVATAKSDSLSGMELVVNAGGDDAFGRSSEKAYHRFILKFVIFREFVASDRMFRL